MHKDKAMDFQEIINKVSKEVYDSDKNKVLVRHINDVDRVTLGQLVILLKTYQYDSGRKECINVIANRLEGEIGDLLPIINCFQYDSSKLPAITAIIQFVTSKREPAITPAVYNDDKLKSIPSFSNPEITINGFTYPSMAPGSTLITCQGGRYKYLIRHKDGSFTSDCKSLVRSTCNGKLTVGSKGVTGYGQISGVKTKGDIICTGAIMCNGNAVKASHQPQQMVSKFTLAPIKKGQTIEIEDPFKNLIQVHRRNSGHYDIEKYNIIDARLSGVIMIGFIN